MQQCKTTQSVGNITLKIMFFFSIPNYAIIIIRQLASFTLYRNHIRAVGYAFVQRYPTFFPSRTGFMSAVGSSTSV